MDQIAIMKKSWGLLEKILKGEKTCESRWYKNKYPPWNQVKAGDTIWFKNSGDPVTAKATITKVIQFSHLTPQKTQAIINTYGKSDLGVTAFPKEKKEKRKMRKINNYFKNKNYCLLVFFEKVEKVKPFKINKKGFGCMSSWICLENIQKIAVF